MNIQRRPRIANAEWENQKERIEELYMRQDKRLEGVGGVIDVMETTYGFSASKAQYETRLKKWHFRKYCKREDWLTLSRILDTRKEEGKASDVFFDGELIKQDRIQKEIRRHKRQKVYHQYSQVHRLPSYIRINTPTMRRTSLTPSAQLSGSPPRLYDPSPFPTADSTFEFRSAFLENRVACSFEAIHQSNLFPSQSEVFNTLCSPFGGNGFFLSGVDEEYLPQLRNNSSSLELLRNDVPGGRFVAQDDLDFTPMDLVSTQRPSLDLVTGNFYTIPDFSTSMNHLFIRMSPVVEPFIRSIRIPQKAISAFPIEKLCHPGTSQSLRSQSIDVQILYLIFHRLINNETDIRRLENPQITLDKLYKAGLDYLFSLEAHLLDSILDSIPVPYNAAVEQGLFCAAVEMGTANTVEAILERRFNPDQLFSFEGVPTYPLQYSCSRSHVEVTRRLLKFSTEMKEVILNDSLAAVILGMHYEKEQSPAYLDIVSLLLRHGANLKPFDMPSVLGSCDSKLLELLVDKYIDHSHEMFILNGAFAIILGRENWGLTVLSAIRRILEHDFPLEVKRSDVWNDVLTASLSNAALRERMDAIDHLLTAGAQPNSNCLINAARSKNLTVFERFLELGVDPHALNVPSRYSKPLSDMELLPDKPKRTAMSECVKKKFVEGYQAIGRRDLMRKSGDNKESFQLTLIAAYDVGDESLILHLLSFQKHEYHTSIGQLLVAPVKLDQETLVRHLLAAGVPPDHATLYKAVRSRQPILSKLLIGTVCLETRNHEDTWYDILLEAIRWGNTNITQDLIRAGVSMNHLNDLTTADQQDWSLPREIVYRESIYWLVTPLSGAILKGDPEAIELLLASGAQLNVHDPFLDEYDQLSWSMTALAACVVKNDIELVQELLGRGADAFDNSAVFLATVLGKKEILKAILKAFDKQYSHGMKTFGSDALIWAIYNEDTQMILLLHNSADVVGLVRSFQHDKDHNYRQISPLGEAISMDHIYNGYFDELRILLPHGNPDSIVCGSYNGLYLTGLLYAIELGSFETVKTFVEAGVDVSLPPLWGIRRTPLQAAVEVGNEEIVSYLLDQGSDPNEAPATKEGATALQLAAIKGFAGIATTLLQRNADVNAEPAMIDGRTAFEGATEHGRIEMMLFLTQNGADLLSNNQRQYQRAIQFAEKNGQAAAKQFADLLLEAALGSKRVPQIEVGGAETSVQETDSMGDFFLFD